MVLVLCTSHDGALHLYQISLKYLQGFQSYGADMICDGQTNIHTDRQTTMGKQYVSPRWERHSYQFLGHTLQNF